MGNLPSFAFALAHPPGILVHFLRVKTLYPPLMLHYALIFLIVAIIAGVLGFGAISGTAASIAKVLFIIFLVLFLISLIKKKG